MRARDLSKYLDPRRYLARAERLLCTMAYDVGAMEREERRKFATLGIDFDAAVARLNTTLAAAGRKSYPQNDTMCSIHWVLFAGISFRNDIRRILEIGTYDGECASILARLFPTATIDTVDLPPDDPIVAVSYERRDAAARSEFFARQSANVALPNVTLIVTNSVFLPDKVHGRYDLIWVDGGHRFPEIAWDICNAYHLCSSGGFILVDDVILHPRGIADAYVDRSSGEVVQYITTRTGETVTHFLKRHEARHAAVPRRRKFVSLLQKGS